LVEYSTADVGVEVLFVLDLAIEVLRKERWTPEMNAALYNGLLMSEWWKLFEYSTGDVGVEVDFVVEVIRQE